MSNRKARVHDSLTPSPRRGVHTAPRVLGSGIFAPFSALMNTRCGVDVLFQGLEFNALLSSSVAIASTGAYFLADKASTESMSIDERDVLRSPRPPGQRLSLQPTFDVRPL